MRSVRRPSSRSKPHVLGGAKIETRPNAVDDDLVELVERLEVGAEHVGTRARNMLGVRRVLLPRIRYYVYFRVLGDTEHIAAFWHASRGTDPDVP